MTKAVLFQNVNIFDGEHEKRIEKANVLVEGNLIKTVSTEKIAAGDATVIEGGGRTLMPGLIDAHWHSMYANISMAALLQSDFGYITLAAAKGARETLMRGFTTVRDIGGNCFAVKKATDEGMIIGPRVYP